MEKLEDVFEYDETSPTCLRWKVDRFSGHHRKIVSAKAGSPAGGPDARGEACVTRWQGKYIKVHKVIAALVGIDVPDGHVIDHEDGNPMNNRKCNLRVVLEAVNARNRKKQNNNTSGTTGVNKWTDHRGTTFWKVRWNEDGKRKSKCFSIGKYGDEEALVLATAHRSQMIDELNSRGYGYTERHGK